MKSKHFSTLIFCSLLALNNVNAQQLFHPPTCFDVGLGSRFLMSADFNKDGKLDIASADWGGGTTSVILGNGDGTFNAPYTYLAGNSAQAVCTADFNGDGKLDLATANSGSNTITILNGIGNGQFSVAPPLSIDAPMFILSDDFNIDGKADLAVALNDEGRIAILIGDGNGGFAIQKYSSGGSHPCRIAKADFDNDGNTDLAVANNGDGAALLKGNGFGGFVTTDSFINIPVWIRALVPADMNNDGKTDLFYSQSDIFSFKYITPNLKFDINSPIYGHWISAGVNKGEMVSAGVADFNEDGWMDVACARYPVDSFSVNIGVPGYVDSFVIEAQNYFASCAHTPYWLHTADFNGDGHADLATSNESSTAVSIFMNKLTAPTNIEFDAIELANGNMIIYPNPVNTKLHIKTERSELREFFSCTGTLLYSTIQNEIDISQYARGIYYLKCGGSVRKVVVE